MDDSFPGTSQWTLKHHWIVAKKLVVKMWQERQWFFSVVVDFRGNESETCSPCDALDMFEAPCAVLPTWFFWCDFC